MTLESAKAEESAPRHDSGVASSREALWRRLELLLARAYASGLERLTDLEVKDLGRLYRAAATHLALLQTFGASARQREELNRLVVRAHGVIYGRARKGANLRGLYLHLLAFPESVRRLWRHHAVAALLLGLGLVYGYVGSQRDMDWALEFAMDERTPFASREELLETLLVGRPGHDDRAALGTSGAPAKAFFAAFLWRHNTTIAVQSFFSGFLLGIPTVLTLIQNGAFLGTYTFTFHHHGLAHEWWAWILPHGVTELLAIVLLSGGGLFIAYSILAPGELSRIESLVAARGDALRHLLFAFPMLLLAALIESFVRQSGLSDAGRYAFAAASAAFWIAFLGFGQVPGRMLERIEATRTMAERAIPLPAEEEIFAALARRRRVRG